MLRQIGELQLIPAEESTTANIGQRYKLSVDYRYNSLSKIDSVSISNSDERDAIVHNIKIKGINGLVRRTLLALINALEEMDSTKTSMESQMNQEIEELRLKGETFVPNLLPPISREELKSWGFEKPSTDYNLTARMSRFFNQDIFFIIQGTEKDVVGLQ